MMKKTKPHLMWIVLVFIVLPCFGADSTLRLNPEELAWINAEHTVRVRIGSAPPFMLTDGEIRGIAIDYLTTIFNRNGIKFSYVREFEVTWPQALKYIEQHDVVDMVPTAKITDERKKHMLFTDEYIVSPWVIFTRSESDFVSSIDDLKGNTVSVEEGFVIHSLLKQGYPEINLKVVSAKLDNNFAEIPIKDLSTGLVDAYIGNLIMTTYMIQSKGYTNVKVAAPTPFENHNQAMAIRNDWPELVSIINKTIAAMTPEDHAAIRNRWLSIRYEYGIDKIYVLKWVLGVAGIASLFIGFVLVWNRRLKAEIILRKKIETALKDSEKKFKTLFNKAQVALFRTGISDGKLIEINQRYANIAGYQTIEDCMSAFNAADAWADASERDKLVKMLKKKGSVLDYETKIIRRDRVAIWISFSAAIYPEKGYIEGSIIDITKRKLTEERLQNSQQLLNEVGSIARIGGWEHDLITGEATWTRESYNIVEIESGPVPGPDEHLSYYPPKDREILEEAYRSSIETGEQFDLKLQAATAKGRSLWVRVVGRPEYKDGVCVKMKGILQNITEQKTVEMQLQQAQKMESIGTLAGGIAHDFNNIMGIILGNAELALEDVPEWNPAQTNLEEIRKAGLRAANIVRQLLTFTRITDQTLQPIEIAAVIKDGLTFLRSTIPTFIDIEQDICVANETILADPSQINQVMMNLCINASHAMEQTGGKLTVSVDNVLLDESSAKDYPDLKIGKYIRVGVSDTGPGIDPKVIDRIFDPYFTTREVGKGSGMGLAVVHGIVKGHGGAIMVDSTPGKGTKFSMLFPLAQGKAAVEAEKIPDIPRGNETILFVDDEISIVKMVQKMFERLGYNVQTALTPQEALDRFAENPDHFDLVITDMTMPRMTGVKLSEKLMAIRPDIPIIICTGHSALVDEEKAKKLGLAAYVTKPINMSEMAQTIRKVLDKK